MPDRARRRPPSGRARRPAWSRVALVAEIAARPVAARGLVRAVLVALGAVGRLHRVVAARLDTRDVATGLVLAGRAIVAVGARHVVVCAQREPLLGMDVG